MKKILAILLATLLVLLVVLLFFLGHIIKAAVETVGPQVTGVSVTLDKAGINLLSGSVQLKGLVIGNPEGYKTPSAMELGHFVVDLDMRSLLTDTLVIRKIHIDAPQITYEQGLKGNNLGRLQKNLAPAEERPEAETPASPDKPAGKPAKKIVIEDFLLENGKIHVSMTLAGGRKLTLPLPPVHLQNIGTGSQGASIAEVVNKVLGAVISATADAVAASGDLAGDALKGAGDAAADAVKGTADTLKKGIGGLLGK